MKVDFTKDDFHVFLKFFRNIWSEVVFRKFCQKSSFLKIIFSNIQMAKNGHVSKLKTKNLVRKCLSQR
jgi:hypothetical protein